MSSGDRRTLGELIARYKLEPSLRDVYVEGPADVHLLRWWFSESGLFSVAVYEIDTIEVPPDLLASAGFGANKRGCVLGLAYALEQALGAQTRQATCVVDSDLEFLYEAEGARVPTAGLALVLRTDYSSMEMYLFRPEWIAKYLALVCGIIVRDPNAFLGTLASVLRCLFCVRATNQTLALAMSPVKVERSLKRTADGIELNARDYLNRYLNSNGRAAVRDAFVRELDRHASAATGATGDPRKFMHGHDFVALLGWYVRKCARKFRSVTPEAVEAAVWGCCESAPLGREQLFVSLRIRAAG